MEKSSKKEALARLARRRDEYRAYGYDVDAERDFVIDKALPLGPRILETGTGKGYFTLALARRGYRLTTIDISEAEQAVARFQIEIKGLAGLVDFRIEDGEKTSFAAGSFDTVFSVNLLHHLKNGRRAIDEMIRVMAPGGKLIITDFSEKGFSMLDDMYRKEGGRHEVSPYGIDEAEKYLRSRGFTVEVHRTGFHVVLIAS